MATKKRPRRRGLGSIDSTELNLYIDNDYPSYQHKQRAFIGLAKHVCRGNFTKTGAEKMMKYVADAGGKKYMREMGSPGQSFSVTARKEAAREMADEFRSLARSCVRQGFCNDLPAEAARLLKSEKCRVGGELDGARKRRR